MCRSLSPAWFLLPLLLPHGLHMWAWLGSQQSELLSCVAGEVASPHDRLSWSQKVTRTSVHSQRLLFQLEMFAEQL